MSNNNQNPDIIAALNINFRFIIKASVLSLTIAAPFIFIYGTTNNKNHRETLNFAATAITTSIAGVSAFHVLQSIRQNTVSQKLLREQEEKNKQETRELEIKNLKIDRAFKYIMMWNDSQHTIFKNSVAEAHDFINDESLNALDKEEKIKKYLDDNPNKKQDIVNLLNFLESMSICIKEGIVDEDLLLKFYRFIVIRYWDTFDSYILTRRKATDNYKIYKELEMLSEKWKSNTKYL